MAMHYPAGEPLADPGIPDECPAGGEHEVICETFAHDVPGTMGGQSIEVYRCEKCGAELGVGRVLP